MDAIVRCGRCLAGGRGCLLKGPHLIPSLKFRLPYLINVHQSINPFLLKSRGMKYCPSGKNPDLLMLVAVLNCSFIMTYVMLTTFTYVVPRKIKMPKSCCVYGAQTILKVMQSLRFIFYLVRKIVQNG